MTNIWTKSNSEKFVYILAKQCNLTNILSRNLINFGLFGHIVIFGSFLETNAHQEIANDFGLAFETLQVHGTVQQTH